MTGKRSINLALGMALVVTVAGGNAEAQSIIKQPGAHPKYIFEAEPHLVVGDRHDHADSAVGPGFRGTVVIVDNGFIPKLNDSVGVGFGLDWLALGDDHCHGNNGNGNGNGNDPDYCHDPDAIVIPVVLQWNFWLHRKWSVFGEPGFATIFGDDGHGDDLEFEPFVFHAGGRFLFSDSMSLTLRMGFPFQMSVGVSFLL